MSLQQTVTLSQQNNKVIDEEYFEHPLPRSADDSKHQIIWKMVLILSLIHVSGIYGGFLFFSRSMWMTRLFAIFLYIVGVLGVTAGAHRLWSHKSYKARLPLSIMLMIFQTMALQLPIFYWARDHRFHHKYTETDADPYNSTRGLFFSHVGWVMVKKHPLIKEKGSTIDISDLLTDPVVQFQKKHYAILTLVTVAILPTYIATLWGESGLTAFFVCNGLRIAFLTNMNGLINSLAHYSDSYKWGKKPYDRNIGPVDHNPISVVLLGEGYHNYHHVFPWDYQGGEFGSIGMNFTKIFIDTMAKIGWAYDMKTVSKDIIEKRVKRTGDGSHFVWGWGDKDISKEHKENVTILHGKKN